MSKEYSTRLDRLEKRQNVLIKKQDEIINIVNQLIETREIDVKSIFSFLNLFTRFLVEEKIFDKEKFDEFIRSEKERSSRETNTGSNNQNASG